MSLDNELFVSIEGANGVGKTTYIESLSVLLNSVSDVRVVRFPGDPSTPGNREIRELVGKCGSSMGAESKLLLFLADAVNWMQTNRHVSEKTKKPTVYVMDRGLLSTLVYSVLLPAFGASVNKSRYLQNRVDLFEIVTQFDVVSPDVTVYLEARPETATSRMFNRVKPEGKTVGGYFDTNDYTKTKKALALVQSLYRCVISVLWNSSSDNKSPLNTLDKKTVASAASYFSESDTLFYNTMQKYCTDVGFAAIPYSEYQDPSRCGARCGVIGAPVYVDTDLISPDKGVFKVFEVLLPLIEEMLQCQL